MCNISAVSSLSPYRESYFSFCRIRGGYAGVATYCETLAAAPVAAEDGMCGTPALIAHKPSMGSSERICFPGDQAFWSRQGNCLPTDSTIHSSHQVLDHSSHQVLAEQSVSCNNHGPPIAGSARATWSRSTSRGGVSSPTTAPLSC